MLAELTHRLLGVENVLRGVGLGMRGLDERMRVLAEQQATLIRLLTPKEKPRKNGPGLDELLAAIVVRLDTQNYLLKDVSDVVNKAMTALPLSVVQAFSDAFQPAGPAANTLQNGHQGGGA